MENQYRIFRSSTMEHDHIRWENMTRYHLQEENLWKFIVEDPPTPITEEWTNGLIIVKHRLLQLISPMLRIMFQSVKSPKDLYNNVKMYYDMKDLADRYERESLDD